ncbi:hypothetical protein [Secundilactobacillus silagei]|mgnify:CR=1 FL=1|uniref:Uncharacterized protein n=1 Tax=Secundilactobacillus silagei JCM 19001 TaxID=1302250 RepID=A0A1Z5IKQ4_9LACO|nr:hypothetical protein [Secundilactobacillus silagei]TDG70492.1 hypothetical protein C5L25_001682 [Secundilactobacillus silagei JCM 19001]GAX02340.1 hypothetical protein IWT126_02409 [Secundilactobacillus silagei JCM 19001]
MLSEKDLKRPLLAELKTITLPPKLVAQLQASYAWVAVEGEQSFASLISPVGTDEVALAHFMDNAQLNHHDLKRFKDRNVSDGDILASFKFNEVTATTEQYLGTYLLQQVQHDARLLPLMGALSLARYDTIGVFAAMLTSMTDSVADTLIEMSARLLARIAPQLETLDHVPAEADVIVPADLVIAVEDQQGHVSKIPVAMIDWLADNLAAIKQLASDDEIGLLNLLNGQTDDNSLIIRDWLIRNNDDSKPFTQWIFQQR